MNRPALTEQTNPPTERSMLLCAGSVLTWTMYLLAQNPEKMVKAQEEIDRVIGSRTELTTSDFQELKYVLRCVNESMRLYPHPPVLLRRALLPDVLPGGL